MKKGDKGMKIWGLIVILMFVMSCFSWAAGSEEVGSYKINAHNEQDGSLFNTTEANEVANKSICSVTLITGDVVIVSTLPDGKRGFATKPADPTKLRRNFQIFETPKGTYIFPEGIDLRKLDKELFNIDYLIREGYRNLTYLPVLVDYKDKDKEEKRLGAAALKELEKEVNITIVKSYRSIPTFSAKLSFVGIDKTFKTLIEKPEIEKIWLDKKIKASLYESVPLIGAPELWKSGYNGSGLEIAILDTGIDGTHPDLDDMDDNPATDDPKVIRKKDFTDDNTTEDLYGHGTHCAGIAAGTGNAPSTAVYPLTHETKAPQSSAKQGNALMSISSIAENGDKVFREPEPGENELREVVNEDVNAKERFYTSEETLPDAYEPDDNYWLASWIPTNGTKQLHNFHVAGDLNYMKFNATEDKRYLIETSDLGNESDTYMYLYDTDGLTEITHDDDSGEGLASRIIWKCDASGTYYVKVRHYNISACGPYTYYNLSVSKYIPPAEFNDVYADYGEDTDNDGLHNYLVIDVGVNVTKAGRYQVSGSLRENTTYRTVAYAYNTTYLQEGDQTVQLKFDGITIRQNEYDGRYDLKYLYLYNMTYPYSHALDLELEEKIARGEVSPENVSVLYGERLDYRYYAYTTGYYEWAEFQRPPAEFNDVYSDYGEDTDGDGLDNSLVIEVGVNVTKAGRYRVRGDLYENATWHYIISAYNTTYLGTGNHSVLLKFDGIRLRQNKYNGTYDLRYLSLYNYTYPYPYAAIEPEIKGSITEKSVDVLYGERLDYRYYAYTTGYYDWAGFQRPPAEFNDVYADYGEDTDNDGLHNYLVIEVGVNVTKAGRYQVSGSLYENATYKSVAYAYNTTYLREGNQTVQLRFEGITIRQNKYDGRYDLRYLYLYNRTTYSSSHALDLELEEKIARGEISPENVSVLYGERLDYRYYAYTTSYYNWTEFQRPPAEFNDVYSDHGEDTDGDGLNNSLVIEVGVNVTKAGRYQVRGYLYENATYSSVAYAYNTTYLQEGDQTVKLKFDGITLRQNKYDGRYDLKYLYLYNMTYPYSHALDLELEQKIARGEISPENVSVLYGERLDYRYYAYTTGYYDWTGFQKPPAEFNDVYSDYGEDTDNDGLHNYLVIEVGVNVTKAGRYQVRGSLYENATYSSVAYAYNTTYLQEGDQTVQLKFDGITIRQNKYDGRYDLRYLYLYNRTTYPYSHALDLEQKIARGEISPENVSVLYGEQLDYRYYAYTTGYYEWTEFQRPPAEFNDVYSDYGEDTDGDGLNNSLIIEVGVNVTKAGRYRVRGELYENATWDYIISAYNTTYLDTGDHSILLKFDGLRLRQNKYNGTYDLRYLGLYNYTYPYPYAAIEPEIKGSITEKSVDVLYGERLDYRYYAYTTGYYEWAEFQRPPAEFNDIYSDYGVDTDGDGLNNSLVIEVGVNVTKAGRYRVRGDLYENATWHYIISAYNTTYLDTGNHSVQLKFDGIRLRQNKYNGTYDLRYLYLYSRTYPYSHALDLDLEQKIAHGEISPENVSVLYGERLDYRYYAYTTGYYEWAEFQRPPAEFNDVYSDYGEDTDGDGLNNSLVIEVGVNVTKAGRYKVEGSLYDSQGNYIEWKSNSKYLSPGNQTIKLKFDGIKIRKNGVSGTFDLRYLYLYDASWKRLDYKYYAYTTAYYNYTDFQEFARYIGVAPGAEIWNVKVLNKYGSGYMSWIIDGIEYAAYGPDGIADTEDEADIISMSLGGAPTDGTDPLSRAVNNAVDSGVVVAVAAGNAWDYFTIGTPGAAEKVITVGASTKYDELAWFSSKGPTLDLRVKPDVVAPGVSIVAPRANNTTMGYPYNDYYTSASGTSMSTPHVAGAAALILQVHPGWTPEEVKNILISTAEDLGYNVYQQGGGRIYVPYAADPKILVNPATISFKNLDTTSKAITFKNLDTVTHTLTLNVTVREVFSDMQVDCTYLNRTSLSIAPGSSASVLLTINATSLPKSLYSGKVSATYSTSTGEVHSIFGFSNWNKVTVNKINMAGEPGDYDLVLIFADERYAWRELKMQDKWTDENGTAAFYLPDGTYNIISGWGDVKGASVYTVKENVTIESDMSIILDERTAKVIDFDYNKSGQIMSEKSDKVYYKGENVSVSFGSLRGYPNETRTFVTLTSFETIFIYSYYPEEYYNKSNRWLVNASEWHKLLYNLSSITENVTFSPDYSKLVERTADYKVAMEPELAERVQFAWHPDMWCSCTWIYKMDAPLHRIEWLSSYPISYTGGYEQYAEWWNLTFPDWEYDMPELSYPTGSKPYFAVGEHPFKSGAEIDISHWGNYLRIYGTISEDTFGNSFTNKSRCNVTKTDHWIWWRPGVSGNITVIKDGVVIVDHEDIWDHFWESVYFFGTPKFKVIIQGNSSARLSTYTRTEMNFVADPTRDYQPPEVTMRVLGSDLYNKVPGGVVKVRMGVEDESNIPISDVTLEYSLDNGTTWNSASITYKGVTGCKPVSGGNRTVVDETYASPTYSKVRIFMDDTEDNDEIHYNYIFTLKKSDGTEYTKSWSSASTIRDINDTLYYDEDNDGVLDLFKSIYIGAYTGDNDTLDVKVEAWDGALWKCLYGKKIKEYEADLGFVSDKYVSLRANATDAEGNSISQTVIKGFALKIAADMPDLSPVISVPSSAFIGDTVDINVTVYNRGTVDSNATTLDVYVNDVSIGTKSVPVINPDSHQVFTVPWTPSSIGVYTIKAVVDSNDTNNESNEYNNIDIKQVSVVPKVVSPGYPSIMGTHTGNFTPDQDINVSRMYTYPCSGTGGHSKYAAFYYPNGTEIASGNWTGYQGNYHYIYFSEPFKLEEGITYRYKIITGSYPQIYHSQSVLIPEGTITCTKFTDANGKTYTDWIPAIRLE